MYHNSHFQTIKNEYQFNAVVFYSFCMLLNNSSIDEHCTPLYFGTLIVSLLWPKKNISSHSAKAVSCKICSYWDMFFSTCTSEQESKFRSWLKQNSGSLSQHLYKFVTVTLVKNFSFMVIRYPKIFIRNAMQRSNRWRIHKLPVQLTTYISNNSIFRGVYPYLPMATYAPWSIFLFFGGGN